MARSGKRFDGSRFSYSTANIVEERSQRPIVRPYVIKYVKSGNGARVPVGIINLTTDTTVEGSTSYQPELSDLSLVETANAYAAKLQSMGVQSIVVSAHEGPTAGGQYWTCNSAPSGPMADFAKAASPAIDVIVTGHWHTQFLCTLPDPDGNPRPVVEAGFHGKLINEIQLKIDPRTKDVIRLETKAINHPVTRDVPPDPKVVRQVDYWVERASRRTRERSRSSAARLTGLPTRPDRARSETWRPTRSTRTRIAWGTRAELEPLTWRWW